MIVNTCACITGFGSDQQLSYAGGKPISCLVIVLCMFYDCIISDDSGLTSCLQGLTDPPGVAQTDIPGLQLALAVIISLYIFRDKKRLGLGERFLCCVSSCPQAMYDLIP